MYCECEQGYELIGEECKKKVCNTLGQILSSSDICECDSAANWVEDPKNPDECTCKRGFVLESSKCVPKTCSNPGEHLNPETYDCDCDDGYIKLYDACNPIKVGETFLFGKYEQDGKEGLEDIEWIVLEKNGSEYLLISKYILDGKPYNLSKMHISWNVCTLRSWLNGYMSDANIENASFGNDNFIQTFTSEEKSLIVEKEIVTNDITTHDKIFLLSRDEATNYFNNSILQPCTKLTPVTYNIVAHKNSECGDWWLRNEGNRTDGFGDCVNELKFCNAGITMISKETGVRPILWIKSH